MSSVGRWGLALMLAAACTPDSGQEYVEVPLFVAGTDQSEPLLDQAGVELTLSRAQLAFGPLYLCAGAQAGDSCETARLEWLDSAVVDLLSEDANRVGRLQGVTGSVNSWMFDLGISSQLTTLTPVVLDAAEQLGDVSLRLEGTASSSGSELDFSAHVAVQRAAEGEQGLPVVRRSQNEAFAHDVQPDERGLVVRFDVAGWLSELDLSDAFVDAECEAGQACSEALRIDEDSVWHDHLRFQMEAGARPQFEWR